MKMQCWKDGMSDEDSKNLAYWERNMLALKVADGWYNDDVWTDANDELVPRFTGWRRVLSCFDGSMCFHIPDDFEVGNLPMIGRNWDGHTTIEKWSRVAAFRGIEVDHSN